MFSRVSRFIRRAESDRQHTASLSTRDFPQVLRLNLASVDLAPDLYRARCRYNGLDAELWSELPPALKQFWIQQAAMILTRKPR